MGLFHNISKNCFISFLLQMLRDIVLFRICRFQTPLVMGY